MTPRAQEEIQSWQKWDFSLFVKDGFGPAFYIADSLIYLVLSTVCEEKHPPPLFPENPQELPASAEGSVSDMAWGDRN